MAPEVILQHPYDEKVDVWSLGVILYALITGYLPFCDVDENEAQIKTVLEHPEYNSKAWARASGQAKALTQQMLSKDIQKRPSLPEILQHPWLSDREKAKPERKPILKPSARLGWAAKLGKLKCGWQRKGCVCKC